MSRYDYMSDYDEDYVDDEYIDEYNDEDDDDYEKSYEEQYIERDKNRDPRDFGMYLKVVDSFRMNHPDSYRRMKSWYPVGRFDIEIILNDGTRLHYDFFRRSVRRIIERPINDLLRNKELYKKEFGRRLKLILRDKMITQKMLSEMTGISENTISSYISGRRMPEAWAIDMISSVIPCTTDELMGIE